MDELLATGGSHRVHARYGGRGVGRDDQSYKRDHVFGAGSFASLSLKEKEKADSECAFIDRRPSKGSSI